MSKFINAENLKTQYEKNAQTIKDARVELARPLTFTEKIIFTHFYKNDINVSDLKRGESDLELAPDRVVMQDATAQMAVLQFISAQVPRVKTATSIHCDHLIRAIAGGSDDLEKAKVTNKEVYEFLGSAAKKYGMDFWEPGSGIIHTIALENYATPGALMIGTDSHTPTAGGLGMMAIGVGGADAVDVMTSQPWQLKNPKIVGIKLTGELSKWASAKDVILYICGKLSTKGGTGKVLEYFGEGAATLDTAAKATITNMGAEVGATTSVFAYDSAAESFLKATDRADIASLANEYKEDLQADAEVLENPNKHFDEVIEIDLTKIEPAVVGPDTPDAYFPVSRLKANSSSEIKDSAEEGENTASLASTAVSDNKFKCPICMPVFNCCKSFWNKFLQIEWVKNCKPIQKCLEKCKVEKSNCCNGGGKNYSELGLPEKVSTCLIGSCTNSSYRDFARAASILTKAKEKGLKLKTDLLVSPGSNKVAQTLERDGILNVFREAGAKILTNSCGPCIGQWDRSNSPEGTNVIVTTFNRNFKKRNDGREDTKAFLAGAELTVAIALAGKITFDPANDTITNDAGEEVKLDIENVASLPEQGFAAAELNYVAPVEDGSALEVIVIPTSERIQLLKPFNKWEIENDFKDLYILVKAKGKCTTDHISAAGPWLKYRGHLDNISGNMYMGAVNAFSDATGKGKNIETGEVDEFNKVARAYKEKGIGWVVVGDENYGEGSSREHAAMEPRFLGACAVITKSFARIAETNLKKQGVLPLALVNASDYDKFSEEDKISITNLENLTPDSIIKINIKHKDGEEETVEATHTMSAKQIEWFYAGSALNSVAK